MRPFLFSLLFSCSLAWAATDFNGTTSKCEHTTADLLGSGTTITVCAWIYADGRGEGTGGVVTAMDETQGANALGMYHDSGTDNRIRWQKSTDATAGLWFVGITGAAWNSLCFAHDYSNTTNDPTARLNYADVTPTQVTNPTGTVTTNPATGYIIGNRSASANTWDGGIAYVQWFNVILTTAEMDQAMRLPGSVTRGRILYVPLVGPTDVNDLSGNGNACTASNLTDRGSHPAVSVEPIGGPIQRGR